MTKRQCETKIRSMRQDLCDSIINESIRLMNCGALDLSAYKNDFLAPKMILTAALENRTDQYTPGFLRNSKNDRAIRNLRHF